MASWQHLALGAVAAAGVGLALYHAKNCKMEERLEKERTQLYNDVRNGDARFVDRMTDPQRARNKWRQMDVHERKAALFINREELARNYTRNLRNMTGKSIPHPVYVSEHVVKHATMSFKLSLEQGVPVVLIPPTNRPSEVLEFRAVIEMLESQLDDGLTVPMMQFRKALMNWQLLQALQVVWSSLTVKRFFNIYFHLIFLWFGLGMLDHATGSQFGVLGLPSRLWKASGGSYLMYSASHLGISSPFNYIWTQILQPVTNTALGKMIRKTIDSHMVEFVVLFLAQYLFCAQMSIVTSFLCTLCEFIFIQMLGDSVFWLFLCIVWVGMFLIGCYYTLAVTTHCLVTVISLWNKAGLVISNHYRPVTSFILDERETPNHDSLLPIEFQGYSDGDQEYRHGNLDGNTTDSSLDHELPDFTAFKVVYANPRSTLSCSYCHKRPKPGQQLRVCCGCNRKYYCNQRCEDYDWIRHRANCSKKTRKRRRKKNN